jgi:hypothetical protein
MPCPFPGFDPYLEMQPFWSDFAPKLLTAISNDLLSRLVPRYDVRIEEYIMLTEEDRNLHRFQPDVTVSAGAGWMPGAKGGLAVAEPVHVELEYPDYEPLTQRRLKIIHRPSERVVTAIELLSPSNKAPGADAVGAYLDKRAELIACRCHLVEIDLLRGGQRLPMVGDLPPGDYFAYIGRVGKKPRCEVIAWSLRSPLPTVPIPLLAPDPDDLLDLQVVFRTAYEPALYDRRLPYDSPLDPPLRREDEAWVREALMARKAGQ